MHPDRGRLGSRAAVIIPGLQDPQSCQVVFVKAGVHLVGQKTWTDCRPCGTGLMTFDFKAFHLFVMFVKCAAILEVLNVNNRMDSDRLM